MNNFIFQNPTKLIFGQDTISQLSKEIPQDKKILIVFGGGSAKSNGVYAQVAEALKDHNTVEFWGIEPNPKVETLREAVALGKLESVDFILSVGGGSVLDGTKLIAASIPYAGDAWELVLDSSKIGEIVPFASIMTLPATGSEMNSGAVISNLETNEKYAFYSTFPQFSILDPKTTYSLPAFQVACGVADTFVHTIEQYLIETDCSPLMDRWAEGIMLTLKEVAPKIKADQTDYAQMSNYMLCATMALNGFTAMGVAQDWATHMIGHEVTAFTGVTHGQTLAIILPATMTVLREQKGDKIIQYGERVWNIVEGSRDEKIDATIEATKRFFGSLGLATSFSELKIERSTIDELVERLASRGVAFGDKANVSADIVKEILYMC